MTQASRIIVQTMSLNVLHGHVSWLSFPFPFYVFVFSCFVYLLGPAVWAFINAFFSVNRVKGSGVSLNLDQAEKGSLKKQKDMSDDEVFQLEKRAFFSKVGPAVLMSEAAL